MNFIWRITLQYLRWEKFSGNTFEGLNLKQKLINITNQNKTCEK